MSPTLVTICAVVYALTIAAPLRAATTVESRGNAHIDQDSQSGTWTIGAGGSTLTVTTDESRDLRVTGLISPSGQNWVQRQQSDNVVTINGTVVSLGSFTDD